MARYKITVEYDGCAFVGWQRQKDGTGVQASLVSAISKAAGESPDVTCAGRTDAGVHARGQVAHFDLAKEWQPARLMGAINAHLRPLPVVVLACERAADDFHARFQAKWRRYEYVVVNRRPPLALEVGRAALVAGKLNVAAMREAAAALLGKHDFSTFRAVACQAKSPVRTLDALDIQRYGDRIVFTAEARSFLHHQVRNMVGSLLYVGLGKWSFADFKRALDARDRTRGGPTAPPEGLYLAEVAY